LKTKHARHHNQSYNTPNNLHLYPILNLFLGKNIKEHTASKQEDNNLKSSYKLRKKEGTTKTRHRHRIELNNHHQISMTTSQKHQRTHSFETRRQQFEKFIHTNFERRNALLKQDIDTESNWTITTISPWPLHKNIKEHTASKQENNNLKSSYKLQTKECTTKTRQTQSRTITTKSPWPLHWFYQSISYNKGRSMKSYRCKLCIERNWKNNEITMCFPSEKSPKNWLCRFQELATMHGGVK
jgi:hypothetical protein